MSHITLVFTGFLFALIAATHSYADTINVPDDYPTIQSAINASQDGDLILIQAGTYYEHSLDPQGLAITIRGATDSTRAPAVTINASGFGRVILADSFEGPSTVFENLNLTNGFHPSSGGGIRCNASSPTFRNCTIIENSASVDGGGVFCYSSFPTFIGCTIKDNWCGGNGGGIFCFGSSLPAIAGTVICGNTPDQIYGDYTDNGNNIVADSCDLLGACCIDANCSISTQEDCEASGGLFEGLGTDCTDDPCYIPPVEGACCTNDLCRDSFEDDCLYWGGQWLGDGTECETSFCATACLGDADGDGEVNVNDVLMVISQYGVTCP